MLLVGQVLGEPGFYPDTCTHLIFTTSEQGLYLLLPCVPTAPVAWIALSTH